MQARGRYGHAPAWTGMAGRGMADRAGAEWKRLGAAGTGGHGEVRLRLEGLRWSGRQSWYGGDRIRLEGRGRADQARFGCARRGSALAWCGRADGVRQGWMGVEGTGKAGWARIGSARCGTAWYCLARRGSLGPARIGSVRLGRARPVLERRTWLGVDRRAV
jgi:hypothetical protein